VVILAKNKEAAARMAAGMKFEEEEDEADASESTDGASVSTAPAAVATPSKNVTKTYLARVRGHFPTSPVSGVRGLSLAADGRLVLDAPILTVSLRKGIHAVDFVRGKSAVTCFKLLSFDEKSNTSVVQVQPLTGRTHQIRLHLQYMQHGIVNDPVYGEGAWEGNTYSAPAEHPDEDVRARIAPAFQDDCQECANRMYYNSSADGGLRYCTGIFLHAFSYASVSGSFHFETTMPDWARADFDVVKALGARVKTSVRAVDAMKLEANGTSSAASASSNANSDRPTPTFPRSSPSTRTTCCTAQARSKRCRPVWPTWCNVGRTCWQKDCHTSSPRCTRVRRTRRSSDSHTRDCFDRGRRTDSRWRIRSTCIRSIAIDPVSVAHSSRS
jgi:hypothetical protein